MKATGIVRRIDDLGRIVIPKEIRRTMRIREGDPLEIFVDREGKIILKKYSPLGEIGEFAQEYSEVLAENTGYLCCIADQDVIIAAAGDGFEDYLDRSVSSDVEDAIQNQQSFNIGTGESGFEGTITAGEEPSYKQLSVIPITGSEKGLGAVIMAVRQGKEGRIGATEEQLARTAATFLGKKMKG